MKDVQNIENKLAQVDWKSQDIDQLKKAHTIYDQYYQQHIASCEDSFIRNYVKDTFEEQLNLYLDKEIDTNTLTKRILLLIKAANISLYGNNMIEGSSGTPIHPTGAIPSKDRSELEHLFNDLKQTIDSDKFTVVFNQDRIDIYIKTYSDIAVDQTPYQKHLPEGAQQQKFNYTPYIGSILEYMLDQGMKIHPLPEVKIRYDEQQANDFFGKTAYYDPNKKEVILYAMGRLPKDVCRSFTHEMIHHMQNLEGRLGHIGTTNTNEDDHLQDIEKEAYLKGNMTFRNWEDAIKNK